MKGRKFSEDVCKFLKDRRLNLNLTLQDLTDVIGAKNERSYWNIEHGHAHPSLERFKKMVDILSLEILIRDKKNRFCETPLWLLTNGKVRSSKTMSLAMVIVLLEQTHDIYLCYKENPNKFCKLEILGYKSNAKPIPNIKDLS